MSTAVTEPQEPTTPALFGFPLNRIVAFAGPQISIVAGFIATWIVEHAEFLHLDATKTKGTIVNLIVFSLTAILTWVGQHKWLDGWQKWEQKVTPAVQEIVDPETDGPLDVPDDGELTDEFAEDPPSDLSPEATRGMPLGFEKGA